MSPASRKAVIRLPWTAECSRAGAQESAERIESFLSDPKISDAVVSLHAHIDHSGRAAVSDRRGILPHNLGDVGDERSIRHHAGGLSAHSGKGCRIPGEAQKGFIEPLPWDAARCADDGSNGRCSYNRPFDVVPGVRATYIDAGHILGSASVRLDCTESGKTKRLVLLRAILVAAVWQSFGIRRHPKARMP